MISNDDVIASARRLFTNAHPVVGAAVERFVSRSPGELDLASLELIASAASSFTDQNHVAYMIDKLQISQMRVVTAPIDITQTQRRFEAVLSPLRPETSRKLVLDLVHTSLRTILEDSPPELVPEAGRDIVRRHLSREFKTRRIEREAVLAHPFLSSEMVTAVLDHLEAELDDPDVRDDFNSSVERTLTNIFVPRALAVTSPDDLRRSWSLIDLIENDQTLLGMLRSAVGTPAMLRVAETEILDLISTLGKLHAFDVDEICKRMLRSPALSEVAARRIVKTLQINPEFDDPLSAIRYTHYRQSDELLPELTSQTRDALVALMPVELLRPTLLQKLEDVDAISWLVDRWAELDDGKRFALISQPNVTRNHIREIVEHFRRRPDSTMLSDALSRSFHTLLSSRLVDDDMLVDLISIADTLPFSRVHRTAIGALAARNRSCGPRVLERWAALRDREIAGDPTSVLVGPDHNDGNLSLCRLARNTASTEMQAALAERAMTTNDAFLAAELMSNGMLRTDRWSELKVAFPDIQTPVRLHTEAVLVDPTSHSWKGAASAMFRNDRPAYTIDDVADLVVDGDAPPDRVSAVVAAGVKSSRATGTSANRALAKVVSLPDADEEVLQVTASLDRHLALAVAARLRCPRELSRFRLPAEAKLTETFEVLRDADVEMPPDRGLRSWDQLPNYDDASIASTPLTTLVDGREVGGLTLHTPKTRRTIRELSDTMHNCLDGLVETIAEGEHLLAYAHDQSRNETYAVLWQVVPSPAPWDTSQVRSTAARGWSSTDENASDLDMCIEIVEINSKFNRRLVPQWFHDEITTLTGKINDGSLTREHRPVDVNGDIGVVGDGRRPGMAPRRREAVRLLPVRPPDDSDVSPSELKRAEDAPSLLASSPEPAEPLLADSAVDLQVEGNPGPEIDNTLG